MVDSVEILGAKGICFLVCPCLCPRLLDSGKKLDQNQAVNKQSTKNNTESSGNILPTRWTIENQTTLKPKYQVTRPRVRDHRRLP